MSVVGGARQVECYVGTERCEEAVEDFRPVWVSGLHDTLVWRISAGEGGGAKERWKGSRGRIGSSPVVERRN